MQRSRKLNSSWLANLVAQTSGFLVFIVTAPFLIKLLGKDQFGALTLFVLLPQIVVQLDLGLATAGVRAIAVFKAQGKAALINRIFWEILLAFVMVAVVLFVIFYFSAQHLFHLLQLDHIIGGQLVQFVTVISCWCLLALLNAGVSIPARAFERFRLLATVQAISATTFWLGAFLLTLMKNGLMVILWWGVAVALFTLLLLIVNTRANIFVAKNTFNKSNAWLLPDFFKFGFGAFVAQASSLLTYHADKFLVAALVSPGAAGIYAACTNIASKLLVLVAAIAAFVFPRAVRLKAEGATGELKDVYVRATNACVLSAIVFGIPLIALSEPFLRLWLKAEYTHDYIWVLMLMLVGYVLAAFSVVASNVSIGMGHSRTPAIFAIVGGVGTLGLCMLLAPKFGIIGAAASAAIGMSQAVVFNWLVARWFGNSYARDMVFLLLKAIFVGSFLIGSFVLVNDLIDSWIVLVFAGLFGSICVLLVWLACGFFSKDERDYFLQKWRKIRWS
jgi:O-antigen/teichoic acid export membrane protein